MHLKRSQEITYRNHSKRKTVNSTIILSLLLTLLYYIFYIFYALFFIIRNVHFHPFSIQITYPMIFATIFFIFSILYGIISEFIYEWEKDALFKITIDENEKVKNLIYQYNIDSNMTNKTKVQIDIKTIDDIIVKHNKLIILGNITEKHPMKPTKQKNKFILKRNRFDIDSIYPYLKQMKGSK